MLLPRTLTAEGPVAPEPSGPASDGSPVTMRVWVPRRISVTAPVSPRQTLASGSSGFGRQTPSPPVPASAT
ncbi:hypothetical protein D3C87_1922590 [compost metagenome]